jgi:hypothetical protein
MICGNVVHRNEVKNACEIFNTLKIRDHVEDLDVGRIPLKQISKINFNFNILHTPAPGYLPL